MSSAAADAFETMIRNSGEGWLIDWYAPREHALPDLRERLRRADDAARQRLGEHAPRLTPEALIAAYAENPHKVRAFLQVFGSVASPHFLVMVWQILEGAEIVGIGMQYDTTSFFLHVTLVSPDSGVTEQYESNDIDDAVVLRHLGTMKMDDKGSFDGFYPLNLAN